MVVTWRDAVENAIVRQVSSTRAAEFTRKDLLAFQEDRMRLDTETTGQTPSQTISRVLQELRDDDVIEFVDGRGLYRLKKNTEK